jgi:hypothetical protein
MIRRVLAQFCIRRVWADPIEEHADLELPLLQVRPQQRGLLVVGELDRTELLHAPAKTSLP